MCVTFVRENTSIYAHPGKFVGALVELEMESGTQMAQKKVLGQKKEKRETDNAAIEKRKNKRKQGIKFVANSMADRHEYQQICIFACR